MKYDRDEVFQAGRHTAQGTKTRAITTNFVANHRGGDHVHVNEDQGQIGPAAASPHLDLTTTVKGLTTVLLTRAKEYAQTVAQRMTRTTCDALDLNMLVDSAASGDALPVRFFLGSGAPLRETALSRSNGVTKAQKSLSLHPSRVVFFTGPPLEFHSLLFRTFDHLIYSFFTAQQSAGQASRGSHESNFCDLISNYLK